MEQTKLSIWTHPATILIVTSSALILAFLFERWASSVDGTGFRPWYMIGVLAAVYGTGLIASIVTKTFRKKSRLLADINFITAVLVAIGAIGLADIAFDVI
jgi:4-hydroxybenzoate polyprenyltransferase